MSQGRSELTAGTRQKAKREADEKAKREAEEKAKREAEEQSAWCRMDNRRRLRSVGVLCSHIPTGGSVACLPSASRTYCI